jgi:hypothetical protein
VTAGAVTAAGGAPAADAVGDSAADTGAAAVEVPAAGVDVAVAGGVGATAAGALVVVEVAVVGAGELAGFRVDVQATAVRSSANARIASAAHVRIKVLRLILTPCSLTEVEEQIPLSSRRPRADFPL